MRKIHRQNWKAASFNDRLNYKNRLSETLSNISIPHDSLDCGDLNCKNINHCEALDAYILEIIEAIETTTRETIPFTNAPKGNGYKASRRKCIPGWKEHVRPFKLEANFWYLEWRSAGKPRHGLVYDNMRFYRNKFKYAKRRVLIAAEAMKRDKFLEACLEGDRSLFEELKKIRGSPVNIASKMDGHTDPVNITEHLKNIYEGLYNRTGSKVPLQNLLSEVDAGISDDDMSDVLKVTPELVHKIIKDKIRPDKSDPEFNMTTNNLKQAPYILFVHLANFFRGILIHGSINSSLLVCAILLLIKNRRQ